MYDVSQRYRQDKKAAEKRIGELREENPKNYRLLLEYGELCEKIRTCNINIMRYEKMIRSGIKF